MAEGWSAVAAFTPLESSAVTPSIEERSTPSTSDADKSQWCGHAVRSLSARSALHTLPSTPGGNGRACNIRSLTLPVSACLCLCGQTASVPCIAGSRRRLRRLVYVITIKPANGQRCHRGEWKCLAERLPLPSFSPSPSYIRSTSLSLSRCPPPQCRPHQLLMARCGGEPRPHRACKHAVPCRRVHDVSHAADFVRSSCSSSSISRCRHRISRRYVRQLCWRPVDGCDRSSTVAPDSDVWWQVDSAVHVRLHSRSRPTGKSVTHRVYVSAASFFIYRSFNTV